MAYKQGVACGASVTLLIGSGVLLGLYVACSSLSCKALAFSFLSPVWTGVLLMGTAFVGIFMSTTKSEKGCGGLYLFLSILGILATIGCTCLTLYAFFWEIGLTFTSSVTTYTRTSFGSFATTTTVAPTTLPATQTEPGVLYALWLCMMCVAFVLSIVTCVTSCQYCCCCQEPVVSEQRIVVLTQGQSPQNIFLENTNTIVNQHHPQAIVLNTMQQASNQHYFQQPYPVAQQPFPGHMTVQQPVAFQPPPPYAAVASTGPPCHPQPAMASPPQQQQLAPPQSSIAYHPQHQQHQQQQQQQGTPHAQPSASPAPANQTHPPRPSGSQPSRNELIDSQPVHSARTSDSSTPSASVYQPLIHETRQGTAPDIQHSYEENPQFTGEEDYGHSYTYIDAGPATNSTVHRSNYNPQPAPSVADDGSYIEPATGGESPTQGDSQLYDYVERPSDEEYDDTQVDPNQSATPAVDSSEYVNKAIGKRAKKPKRTR